MRGILQVAQQQTVGTAGSAATRVDVARELVSFRAPTSFEADQYRALRHRVETAHDGADVKVLAFSSAAGGEGKTLTVLNLAGSLAQSPAVRVLVIEADLRRPAIAEYLRLPDAGLPGLADALSRDEYRLGQLARRLEPLRISVLLAGGGGGGTYELLASPRFERLLTEAREAYDYVLIDTPPLVPLADSRLLSRWVDGLVLVVAAHRTPRALVAEALEAVDADKIVAVAFNGDDRPLGAYDRYDGNRPRGRSNRRP